MMGIDILGTKMYYNGKCNNHICMASIKTIDNCRLSVRKNYSKGIDLHEHPK